MIKKYTNKEEVAGQFAEYFISTVQRVTRQNQKFLVALSGGSTPQLFFRELAAHYKDSVDWSKIHFFWGDERMVSRDSPESNYGTAKQLFFDKVTVPPENIHPIDGSNDIQKEILRYSCEISSYATTDNDLPQFDMVILGMGDDGHVASIFPNQIGLMNGSGICDIAVHPLSGQQRITITGKIINNARRVVLLVTGKDKTDKVTQVIHHTENYKDYPASFVSPDSGNLKWFLDYEAGAGISAK